MSESELAPEGQSGEHAESEHSPGHGTEMFRETVIDRFMAMGVRGPTGLLDKVDASQVDRLIDISEQSDKRADAYKTKLLFATVAVIFGFLVFLFSLCFIFLKFNAKDSMEQIVALIVGLFGGGSIGGGLGFGAGRMTSKSSE